jgi:hypothetical protein
MSNVLQNYNDDFISNEKDIIECYNDIINDYIIMANNNIKNTNADYNKFIIRRGVDTITHCFKLLLIYSKNIDVIKNSCKKAVCYYVEFIGQIGEDSNSFLQLSSKDATLFVYKKIIFDIDQTFRKTFELTQSEKKFIKKANMYIEILKSATITSFLLGDYGKNAYENNTDFKCVSDVIFKKLHKYDFNDDKLEAILFFIKYMADSINDGKTFINVINSFVKKINTKHIDINCLREKLYNNDDNIDEKRHIKFVNWIFS